jgi:diacylglycerol kinase family enzyme
VAGIGIVVNPRAGGVRRDPALPSRLERILGGRGELVVAEGQTEISDAMQAFRSRGVDVLGVVGGDGSNLYTLTAATRVFNGDLPPVALLRGGSVNTVGRALGLRGSPEALLRRLLEAHGNGRPLRTVAVETMSVNGYVGFVFGGALVGKFYDRFYRGKGKGLLDAGWMVVRTVFAAFSNNALAREIFSPVAATVVVDGEEVPFCDFTLMLASTIDSHLGIKVTYRAREEPGRFHVVLSGEPNGSLARQFHKTFLGRPLVGRNHVDRLATRIEVRFDQPSKYIIDGDLYEGDHVVVLPGPRLNLVPL